MNRALLVGILIGWAVLPAAGAAPPRDRVKATRSLTGRFLYFEVADYTHAVIRGPAGKKVSFFLRPGMDYFLALHPAEPLRLTYQVVESFIPEADSTVTIERLSEIRAGRAVYSAWWKQERARRSAAELERKYGALVRKRIRAPQGD
jgi:hypothetical protein